jgi:hypothetical protein
LSGDDSKALRFVWRGGPAKPLGNARPTPGPAGGGDLFTFDRPDLNLIRIVHKRFGDGFNELLHLALPCNRVIMNVHEERV